MSISELHPTECRLLLNPYKITGRELIVSAINELIAFGHLTLDTCEMDGESRQYLKLTEASRESLKNYHILILTVAKEHYDFYPTPEDKDSILSPIRLVRDVYGTLKFSYFQFKRSYILGNLKSKRISRSVFPFYFIRLILTKKGIETQHRLKHLVTELEDYYMYYKENDPEKIKKIVTELGPNILLAYNIERISKELKIWKNEGFFEMGYTPNPILLEDELLFPDMDFPSFEAPTFDTPDLGGGDAIFGGD